MITHEEYIKLKIKGKRYDTLTAIIKLAALLTIMCICTGAGYLM